MKQVILQAEMGGAVLNKLREFTDLPRTGYVAGQSVASAVSELFGDGRAVAYNDVDVFRTRTTEEQATHEARVNAWYERLRVIQDENSQVLNTPFDQPPTKYQASKNLCTFTTQEQENDYGQMMLSSTNRYEVERTARAGMLNEVVCHYIQGGLKNVLRTFDLNAVQIGVDIETEQLVWTYDFERFMATRQLDIVTMHTPLHSLIRYFRKRQELQGTYGNDERILEMVGAAYHLGLDEDGEFKPYSNVRWKFGEIYKSRFDSVASSISPHFELTAVPSNSSPVYLLTPRFDIPKDLKEGTSNIVFNLPLVSRALREKHRKGAQERLQYLTKPLPPRPEPTGRNRPLLDRFVRDSWLAQGDAYVTGNVTAAEMKQLDRVVKNHPGLSAHIEGLSLKDQWERIKALKTAASQRGIWAYGVVESRDRESVDWTPDGMQVMLDEAEVLLNETLKVPTLAEMTLQGYRIREMTTGMALAIEGAELHHCVAGYAYQVKAGNSRAMSFRLGEDVNNWLTLEVDRRGGGGWQVAQFRGLLNRDATDEENAIAQRYVAYFNIADFLGAPAAHFLAKLPTPVQNRCFTVLSKLQHSPKNFFRNKVRNVSWKLGRKATAFQGWLGLPRSVPGDVSWHNQFPSGTAYWRAVCVQKCFWAALLTKVVGDKAYEADEMSQKTPQSVAWAETGKPLCEPDDDIPF